MSKKVASFLSYLFFPGLIPVYILGVFFFVSPYVLSMSEVNSKFRVLILFFVSLYSFVFPALFTYWLYKKGSIQSYKLENLSDRRLPYAASVVFLFFLVYTFYSKTPELFPTAILIFTIGVTVALLGIVSLFWQISAHAASMGGFVGFVGALTAKYDESLLFIPFFIILVFAGLVLSARLKLNAHTPAQVYSGFGLGLVLAILGSLFI